MFLFTFVTRRNVTICLLRWKFDYVSGMYKISWYNKQTDLHKLSGYVPVCNPGNSEMCVGNNYLTRKQVLGK